MVYHILYVDDVIFLGEWSQCNASNLVQIMSCFFLVSGLKINMMRSKLLGVVHELGVANMVRVLGCGVSLLIFFMYLYFIVGYSMAFSNN